MCNSPDLYLMLCFGVKIVIIQIHYLLWLFIVVYLFMVVMKGNGCRLFTGYNICSDSVHPQWCNIFSVMVLPLCFVLCSSDDIDHRSSHTNIAQASSVPFAPPQMPVSASMPWLGSGQTSMGASVVRISLTQTPLKQVMTALLFVWKIHKSQLGSTISIF